MLVCILGLLILVLKYGEYRTYGDIEECIQNLREDASRIVADESETFYNMPPDWQAENYWMLDRIKRSFAKDDFLWNMCCHGTENVTYHQRYPSKSKGLEWEH